MQLTGAVAVVTGATEGIGRAIAFALGKAGARVAICARTEPKLDDTVAALKYEGIKAAGTACDVGDPEQVERFATFVRETFGDPDILVNNAGIGRFAPVEELPLEDWDETMRTNVRSLFLVTRAFLPAMKARGSGHVVNVVSLAGRNGFPGGTAYSASKHAALGFSRSLLLETRKHGIRVLAVLPGSVDTVFFDKAGTEKDNRDRILRPEDVAATVVDALRLPDRATVSELDIRPANP